MVTILFILNTSGSYHVLDYSILPLILKILHHIMAVMMENMSLYIDGNLVDLMTWKCRFGGM